MISLSSIPALANVKIYATVAVAVIAAVILQDLYIHHRGYAAGVDAMKHQQVTADLQKVARDSTARDNAAKTIAKSLATEAKVRAAIAELHEQTQLVDSTHIRIHKAPVFTRDSAGALRSMDPVPDTIATVPREIVDRIIKDSLALEFETGLNKDLKVQLIADSVVIKDYQIAVADLKELKDKPGILSDVASGAVTGAVVGGYVGHLPGAAIGAGIGALTGAVVHVVFRRQ